MARAARAGTTFPRLSGDPVTQWLIEEAAFLALDLAESKAQREAVQDASQESRLQDMARRAVGR